MHRVNRFASLVLFLLSVTIHAAAQQPSPTPSPERTGRSYSSPDLPKTPPPPGPQARSPVTFNNVTAQSGVNFIHAAAKTPSKYLLETMGGGVAIFDFDNDGRMDLFFTNGAALKQSMSKDDLPDKTQPRLWNRLFQQKPDGTFKDVTERAGLKGVGYKTDHLYHNNGDGTFSDVISKLPKINEGWSTSAGWFDYDHDGRLDLFIARYMEWDFESGSMFCGGPTPLLRAYCL